MGWFIQDQESRSYASDNNMSNEDVINAIKSGELNGYSDSDYWYVKFAKEVSKKDKRDNYSNKEKVVVGKQYLASRYGELMGLTEQEVIKQIQNKETYGHRIDNNWYVVVEKDAQKVTNTSVVDYAKENGLDAAFVLEEIAKGIRNGFHENGVWYIGIDSNAQSISSSGNISKQGGCATKGNQDEKESYIGSIIVLVVVSFFAYFYFSSDEPSRDKQINKSNYQRSDSESVQSSPTIDSEKELNCLMRLSVERKQEKNSMSDDEIATLCDQLF